MFKYLTEKYKNFTNEDLDPKKFILDNEAAVYKNLQELYPQTPIGLCRVHLLRSCLKKAISLFSKPIFENNSELQKLWQILKGIFYIPPVSFPVLINYLKTTIRPNLPNLKLKFDEFFVYLEKNYLRVDSKFKPSIWSNFNSVHDLQDPENTSNSIESLNKRLGAMCPNGKISFRKCCELLHSFKCEMLEDYEYAMQNNRLNRQRPQTIRRKTAILDIMEVFSKTNFFDPENLVHFATRFATYNNSNLPEFGFSNLTEL